MVERLIFVAFLFALGCVVYKAFTWWQLKRITAMTPTDPILRGLQPGIPAVVYFTTPGCIPCKTQQQPALHALLDRLGANSVQIVQIDATQDPEAADRWGVMSAPTTFVVDATGKTHNVNHGVADADKLQKQLNDVA